MASHPLPKDNTPPRHRHPAAPRELIGVAAARAETHVVKRLRPSQPGAKKLAIRYGEALVCVRYRHDPTGTLRYTTVELIVDQAPVAYRVSPEEVVLVHIDFDNAELQQQARARGARWDSRQRLWRMTLRLARALRLVGKIVKRERATSRPDS